MKGRNRSKANSTHQKRKFTQTAMNSNKRNQPKRPMRGGYRI